MSIQTADNARRAPQFRKFAEHRGNRGFSFAELASASADRPSLTELATWISQAEESGYLQEISNGSGRRYRVVS